MEVIARSVWGAAPPRAAIGRISGPVSDIFVHHTVTQSGPADEEHRLMRGVQNVAFSRDFSDISYSFLIFPTGRVYEGRGWGKVGAHTKGHNSTSFAMSLVGNYDIEPMTDAQVGAIREMIAEGQRLNHITGNPRIRGHRSVLQTACPGSNAFARLGELRPGGGPSDNGHGVLAFPGLLKRGSRGPDVCAIQARLRALGHDISQVQGCPFGPQTESAVQTFQRLRNLDDDGLVGPNTWAALFAP